ncbi:hypothetical protein KTH93_09985 [Acinetobacter bereziniae]|uniref:hypothetical protein n=1 Tax=Acinetobacter bereziniae TaxID=106648 RepID=UPI0021D03CF9|nr:hypothetical protein [Acinetobacter bereziniae]MCU4435798.1 hypothetical protein [Acinetobacter bereziniae]
MQIHCPYCHSDQIHRMTQHIPHERNESPKSLNASINMASIGATLAKNLPTPIPITPWVGGLAGAVIGGIISRVFEPPAHPAPIPMSYFYCANCQQSFY